MGLSGDEARGSIRFSLGKQNTEEEVDEVLAQVPGVVAKLREMSPAWAARSRRLRMESNSALPGERRRRARPDWGTA